MLFHYLSTCLFLIFMGQRMVDCTLVMDLVNNFSSLGARCLVLVNKLDAEEEIFLMDTNNVSKISIYQYNTNARLSDLGTSGKDCLYNILISDSIESALQFFNRWKVVNWILVVQIIYFMIISDLSDIKTKSKIRIISGETSLFSYISWILMKVRRRSSHSF